MEDYPSLRKDMTRLIIIRHGQSVANFESRFAGHSDFDLTDLGRKQAECAARYLRRIGEKPDAIYSSDLLRAHNTALPSAIEFGLPINDTQGLREIFAGEWESREVQDLFENDHDAFLVWRTDFANAVCTGGESVAQLYARIVRFVCDLAKKHDGETLLLATHATPVRAIDCFSRGWGAERMGDVSFVRNASISIFEYDGGRITPVRVDIVDHLDQSLVTAVPSQLSDIKTKKDE